jgi:peptidoglycan/LPS O-acetylase OafA/YrhL
MAGERPPALLGLAVLGATILAALACFRWIEAPSRAWLRSCARRWGWDREAPRRTGQAAAGVAEP